MLDAKNTNTPNAEENKKQCSFVKKLPDWFNLENYHKANQLDIEGWMTQILFRQLTEDHFLSFVFTGIIEDFRIPVQENTRDLLSPIRPISKQDAILIAEALKKSIPPSSAVWQTPSLFEYDLQELSQSLTRWFNQHIQADEKNSPLADKVNPKILDAFIHVDLNTPDNVLMDAFKKWLQSKLQTSIHYRKKNFSAALLSRWALNQVLPYIDLSYWAKLNKVQIPHWLMGEALFPGNHQGDKTDRVRKTTEKTAKEIMSPICLYSMAAQLKYETGKSLDLDIFFIKPELLETKHKIFIPTQK